MNLVSTGEAGFRVAGVAGQRRWIIPISGVAVRSGCSRRVARDVVTSTGTGICKFNGFVAKTECTALLKIDRTVDVNRAGNRGAVVCGRMVAVRTGSIRRVTQVGLVSAGSNSIFSMTT